jgi:hypothetical protein
MSLKSDRSDRSQFPNMGRSLSELNREKEKDRIRAALFARNTATFMNMLGEAVTSNDYKRCRDFYYRNYDKINLPKARILSRVDFSHNAQLREFLVELGMALDGDNLALDSPMVCALNAAPTPDMDAVDYFAQLGSDVVACDAHVLEGAVKKFRPDVAPVMRLLGYGVPSTYIPCPALKTTYSGENALFDYAIDNDHFELARTLEPDYDARIGRERRREDVQEYLARRDPLGSRYCLPYCCCCCLIPGNDMAFLGSRQKTFLFESVPSSAVPPSVQTGTSIPYLPPWLTPCCKWPCWCCGCVCCFGPGGLRRYCQSFAVCDTKHCSVAGSRACLAGCACCTVAPCLWLGELCDRWCNPWGRRAGVVETCCHCWYPRYLVQDPFRGEPLYLYEDGPVCCRCCC